MVPLLVSARPLASLLSLGLLATIWIPATTVAPSASHAANASSFDAPALVVRTARAPVLM